MPEGAGPVAPESASEIVCIYLGLGLGIAIYLELRMLLFSLRERSSIDPAARVRLLRTAVVVGLCVCGVGIAMVPIFLLTPVDMEWQIFGMSVFAGLFYTPIFIWVRRLIRAMRRRLGDAKSSRANSDRTTNTQ